MSNQIKGTPFFLQIGALLFFLTLSLTVFYYQFNLSTQTKALHSSFKEENSILLKTIQLGLKVGLRSEDFSAIKTVFGWAKNQKNLKWIILLDSENESFASFPKGIDEDKMLSMKTNDFKSEQYILHNKWEGESFGGKVVIGFSLSELKSKQVQLRDYTIKIAFMTFLVVILISILLSHYMISPLYNLQETIEDISKGHLDKKIHLLKGSKEIKQLSFSFNQMMEELNQERDKSEKLMLNILPPQIAARLKEGEENISMRIDSVSILFADIVGFTEYASKVDAHELVNMLNIIFKSFDDLTTKYSLEKIKTIGDNYMVSGGIFSDPLHEKRIFNFAQEMLIKLEQLNIENATRFKIRIGIHNGSAVAGVLGKIKFVFDVWGDTVNVASRMESHGEPGKIHCSHEFMKSLSSQTQLDATDRGLIDIKGKGQINTFFIS